MLFAFSGSPKLRRSKQNSVQAGLQKCAWNVETRPPICDLFVLGHPKKQTELCSNLVKKPEALFAFSGSPKLRKSKQNSVQAGFKNVLGILRKGSAICLFWATPKSKQNSVQAGPQKCAWNLEKGPSEVLFAFSGRPKKNSFQAGILRKGLLCAWNVEKGPPEELFALVD